MFFSPIRYTETFSLVQIGQKLLKYFLGFGLYIGLYVVAIAEM